MSELLKRRAFDRFFYGGNCSSSGECMGGRTGHCDIMRGQPRQRWAVALHIVTKGKSRAGKPARLLCIWGMVSVGSAGGAAVCQLCLR